MTTACVHHWIVEPPAGPTSRGRCSKCWSSRDFKNWDAPRYIGEHRVLGPHMHRQPRINTGC